jgi:transposase-like protein
MPRSGPRAVRKYSDEFKLSAVQLSQRPGLEVKSVAAALEIHPFMCQRHQSLVLRVRSPSSRSSRRRIRCSKRSTNS